MARIPIGLALYSVIEDCERDLPGTLAAVAKMGYEGVEFQGFKGYFGRTAAELRKMMDDVGLKCCGTGNYIEALQGDELQKTVEFNRTLGNAFLIVVALGADHSSVLPSRSAWRESADVFNGIAKKLKPMGMWTGFHNRWSEFQPLEGELPWDTLFGNTVPEVVMQIDTGNCRRGNGDPVAFLEKYPGRALSVHLKEYSKTNGKPVIGEGDVRWQDVFRVCETIGKTQWYIVEQDFSSMESADRSLKALKAMGK